MATSPSLTKALVPILFTIFLVIHPVIGGDDTQALISEICRETSDYAFCSNIFIQNLPSPTADIVGLGQITVNQSLQAATNTEIFVERMISSETNTTLQDLYKICQEAYSIVANKYAQANESFAKGAYSTVVFLESRTERFIDDCQNNVEASPALTEKNRQMKVLINMSLTTVNLIGN